MATYSLGSDDAEIARLEAQAEFLREPTRLLLDASGIGRGMRDPVGVRNPLTDRMTALVMAAFRAAGADPIIGSRLQSILAESGVEDVEGLAIAQYLAHDNPVGPIMLSGVVRSLAPVMIAHQLATEAELDLDTLATRLADSLRSTGSVLVPPLLVGAWGRRP